MHRRLRQRYRAVDSLRPDEAAALKPFGQTHWPSPVHHSNLMMSPRLPRNTKTWPLNGSSCSARSVGQDGRPVACHWTVDSGDANQDGPLDRTLPRSAPCHRKSTVRCEATASYKVDGGYPWRPTQLGKINFREARHWQHALADILCTGRVVFARQRCQRRVPIVANDLAHLLRRS